MKTPGNRSRLTLSVGNWRPSLLRTVLVVSLALLVACIDLFDDDVVDDEDAAGTQCRPDEVETADGSCGQCGANERVQDGQCVCELGFVHSGDQCLELNLNIASLGTDWHPDADGDGVLSEEDVCPTAYDPDQMDSDGDGRGDVCDPALRQPTEDGPVSDLVAEHVTPYGAWLSFTSPRTETYGWGGRIAWSRVRAELGSLASIQQVVDRGDAVDFDINATYGERPHRPIVLTDLEPSTNYYLVLVREDWTGLVGGISNVLEIQTAAAPSISPLGDRPRVMATPTLIQTIRDRHSNSDNRWTVWYEENSSRILQAGEDPESVHQGPWYCPLSALLYHATSNTQYLAGAHTLFDALIAYWEDNTLTGNQYRWAEAALAVCLDLLWNELEIEQRNRAVEAMLEEDEHHVFDDPPRWDDTDDFASVTRTQVIDGLAACGAVELDPSLADRACAVLDTGLRSFYGFQLVKARRDTGFWAQSGGYMPDGSDYGQGTSSYWLQAFWALNNAGDAAAGYAPWILHNLLSMFIHPLTPTRLGYYTQGDVEDFSYNFDLEPSSFQLEDTDASLIALHQGLLASAGLEVEASWARGFIDDLFTPYSGPGAVWHLLFNDDQMPGADARQVLPTSFWDSGLGVFFDRSSWSTQASQLIFRAGWSGLDHSHEDLGHFQLFRRGRWVTHEAIAYDGPAATAAGHNVLLLQQATTEDDCVCQHLGRGAAPSRIIRASVASSHTLLVSDLLGCHRSFYYHSNYYESVQRSLLWLKTDEGGSSDVLVIFDLVDTAADAPTELTRGWQLHFDEEPLITGSTARLTLTGPTLEQQVDVAALLPATTTLTWESPVGEPDSYPGQLYNHRLVAEANTDERALRFVTVIRVGDEPLPALEATAAEGTDLVGVLIDARLVLFANRALGWAFSESEPEGTAVSLADATLPLTVWLSGFIPEAEYDVVVTDDGDELTIMLAPGSNFTADSGGVLVFAIDASASVSQLH